MGSDASRTGKKSYDEYDKRRIDELTRSLIYDRTQSDVEYALTLKRSGIYAAGDLKGAYNSSDRNRICESANYIAELLRIPAEKCRDDWDESSIVRASDNAALISNLRAVKRCASIETDDEIPEDMDGLTYRKANAVEKILYDMYGAYERVCGGLFCGDGFASGFCGDDALFDDALTVGQCGFFDVF